MRRNSCIAAALAVSLACGLASGAAFAKNVQSCVVSVTPLRFGKFNPSNPAGLMMTGSVVFNCTQAQPIAILMDRGGAPAGGMRRMRGPGLIDYNIYFDAGATRVWGDGTGGTGFYSNPSPPVGTNVVIPFFGRIPSGQHAERVGAFTDNIVVRLDY